MNLSASIKAHQPRKPLSVLTVPLSAERLIAAPSRSWEPARAVLTTYPGRNLSANGPIVLKVVGYVRPQGFVMALVLTDEVGLMRTGNLLDTSVVGEPLRERHV